LTQREHMLAQRPGVSVGEKQHAAAMSLPLPQPSWHGELKLYCHVTSHEGETISCFWTTARAYQRLPRNRRYRRHRTDPGRVATKRHFEIRPFFPIFLNWRPRQTVDFWALRWGQPNIWYGPAPHAVGTRSRCQSGLQRDAGGATGAPGAMVLPRGLAVNTPLPSCEWGPKRPKIAGFRARGARMEEFRGGKGRTRPAARARGWRQAARAEPETFIFTDPKPHTQGVR
jgi:hypothetical protein